MTSENYLERMKRIVREAGETALSLIEHSEPTLKPDNSVLSLADQAISKLTREHLKDLLGTPHHILIDEEDPERGKYLDQSLLERTPFVWSIDPIDGTRSYVNRIPNFGISLGLLKNLRPWMGMVYFPLLNELFYCDGENSFFVADAFGPNEKTASIMPIDQVISSQSIFLCHDAVFRDFQWDYKDCHIMIQACAVVDFCWPAIGRSCGSIVKSSLWDFAGSWPIALSAGLSLRHLKTGHVLDRFHVDLFDLERSPWKLKEYYILSSARNFQILKNKLKPIRSL